MYTKISYLRTKLRNFCWRIANKIENNNNCNFYKNGEAFFIKNLLKKFSIDKINKKVVIFDIGANVGSYSEILIKESNKTGLNLELHLFEPQKECFNILQEKFKNNKNIFLNNFGISDQETKMLIYYDESKSGLGSLFKRDNFVMSEEISLKKAKKYIEEKNITHIDFLKIDVEGAELKVLKSFEEYLNFNFISFIQFEYGGTYLDAHITLKEVYDLLIANNFLVGKLLPKGVEIREYRDYMENFNYSNYVAISKKDF